MSKRTAGVMRYEKRFGVIAVELGYIEIEQLVHALRAQVIEEIHESRRRPIGQILLEQGAMTAGQVEEVVRTVLAAD